MSENDEFDAAMEDGAQAEESASPEDVFAELDAMVQAAVPQGQFITFRVESGQPIYVPLEENETGLTIHDAIQRRGLAVSPSTNAYVESRPVPFDTFVPANSVVTLIGMVKGGMSD